MPDYDSMNAEEIIKYETKFRNRFQELKAAYPKWDIDIPRIGEVHLKTVHEVYEEIIKTIVTYQSAMKYKVFLVILFAAIEYFCWKKKKIRAFKNFTEIQIKTIHKYESHLLKLAMSLNSTEDGEGSEWSPTMKFIIDVITSIGTFAGVQGFAGLLGLSAPNKILEEADRFMSRGEGPARMKDDGIPPVPIPPTGWQDPNEIIRRGAGVIKFINGDGVEEEVPQAKPVKQKEADNYDDVYY
jgi:hypothetical protein